MLESVLLQKKRDIFFIEHFSRQTNGGDLTPKPPLLTPLIIFVSFLLCLLLKLLFSLLLLQVTDKYLKNTTN